MFRYKTKVVHGRNYGWQVERFACNQWQRMPFVFRTRAEARANQHQYQ